MTETVKKIDSNNYPFGKILCSLFKAESLEKLHLNENLEDFIKADLGRDSNSRFHKIFYEEIKKCESDLRVTWDQFCKNEIKPIFIREDKIIIQALPNIRIQQRNQIVL